MKRLSLALFFSFVVISSPINADSVTRPPRVESVPISVVLALQPDHVLPGEPPEVTLQVTNTSGRPYSVPPAALEVVPPSGVVFVPQGLAGEWLLSPEEYHERVRIIPPGETVKLVFGRRIDMAWFCDDRMDEPGNYTVRAYLGPNFFQYRPAPLSETIGDDGPFVVSNAVTYTVEVPAGEDAGARALILNRLGNVACGWDGVAETIWQQYPNSHYAAWVPPPPGRSSSEEQVQRLERAIAIDPDGFAADWIRLRLAEVHHRRMGSALTRDLNPNLQEALVENEAFRSILRNLGESENPHVRFEAARQLAGSAPPQELTRAFAELNAPPQPTPPQKINPVVDCVTPGLNGTFTAKFGYNNPNAYAVTIPVGSTNNFTPRPIDRGQTTELQPGRKRHAFAIRHTGGNLVWSLNGKTATASVNHPTRCP